MPRWRFLSTLHFHLFWRCSLHDLRADSHLWVLWQPWGWFWWWLDLERHLPCLVDNPCLIWVLHHTLEIPFEHSLRTFWGGHPLLRSFSIVSWGRFAWRREMLVPFLLGMILPHVLRLAHHSFLGTLALKTKLSPFFAGCPFLMRVFCTRGIIWLYIDLVFFFVWMKSLIS